MYIIFVIILLKEYITITVLVHISHHSRIDRTQYQWGVRSTSGGPPPRGPPPRGPPTPGADSRRWIFEILVQFYISISHLNLIWNGSIFTVFGSLRALYLISSFWDIDFWILWSILYKYTKFHADWTILNFLMTSWPHPPQLPRPKGLGTRKGSRSIVDLI